MVRDIENDRERKLVLSFFRFCINIFLLSFASVIVLFIFMLVSKFFLVAFKRSCLFIVFSEERLF